MSAKAPVKNGHFHTVWIRVIMNDYLSVLGVVTHSLHHIVATQELSDGSFLLLTLPYERGSFIDIPPRSDQSLMLDFKVTWIRYDDSLWVIIYIFIFQECLPRSSEEIRLDPCSKSDSGWAQVFWIHFSSSRSGDTIKTYFFLKQEFPRLQFTTS